MWKIFIFIDQTYFISSKYSFYPAIVTEQIFFIWSKKIIVSKFHGTGFHGAKFHGIKIMGLTIMGPRL